ncbi:DNA repair protein RecN, partial [Streptococcus suis]
MLKQFGQFLVYIHVKNDKEELMKSQHHIRLLDIFGEDEFWSLKDRYHTTFDSYRILSKRVLEKQKYEKEHNARID